MKHKEENGNDLVAVAEFYDVTTAHIVEQMLIANGIEATVMGEVSPYPALNVSDPIKLMILKKDLDKAKGLIEESK
ncbi:MAG: DUF2007 domain-containing protein [Bacteroidales bacterium]|nr:DUF2007 domain-containing protein [Bacteroidales bacterium]